MNKRALALIALVLALTLTAGGCRYSQLRDSFFDRVDLGGYDVVAFSDMEYIRPDMGEFRQSLKAVCDLSATTEDVEQIVEGIYDFYDVYDRATTSYHLANIYYSADLTDLYWEEEYNYCAAQMAEVNAGLEELYYALADSPKRGELESEEYFGPGFFDPYEGESVWDEAFLKLAEREAELEGQYYDLSSQALAVEYYTEAYFTTYGPQMAQLLVELIRVRQQMAAYLGYESYAQFAYDFYHNRDYTPAQAESYMKQIGSSLVDLYRKVNNSDVWDVMYDYCPESHAYRYVRSAAENMGGDIADAFDLMDEAELYDIIYGENKFNSSFEVFLPSYYEPFVFMNPTMGQGDKLTFAHEFGHFCGDYVCGGSYAGLDIAEVQSQAMEYLSLCYGQEPKALESYKLADGLCIYVEQAAYALFEQQMYALEGEDLTVEKLQTLYRQIGLDFGFDSWAWDSRDFVTMTHYYTDPMYLISYVVSNDLALQIYQLEKEAPGSGLEIYKECLYSTDTYILQFADTYALESPFEPERLASVKQFLENALKGAI